MIGFVLAPGAEGYLYQAVQFYDRIWVTRPGVIVIGLITIASVFFGPRYETSASTEGEATVSAKRTSVPQMVFAGVVLAVLGWAIVDAVGRSFLAQAFPLAVAGLGVLAALWIVANVARGTGHFMHDDDADQVSDGGWSGREPYLGMVAAVVVAVYLLGFVAWAGALLYNRGPTPDVQRLWRKAMALADHLDSDTFRIRARLGLAFCALYPGRHNETWSLAELIRIRGRLAEREETPAGSRAAEADYGRALAVAHAQDAAWWGPRAATQLAATWQRRGDSAAARQLLLPFLASFTEGFGTRDLKAAIGLLREIEASRG